MKAQLSENELFIYSGHVATIMREAVGDRYTIDNPKVLRFSVGDPDSKGLTIEVKMWRRPGDLNQTMDGLGVWVDTSVNGEHTGNRHGCVRRYSELLFEAFRTT